MSAKENLIIPLEPNCYFHIFNKGNNSDLIFYKDDNYKYFLEKIDFYMSGYFEFYTYCLLPNHFHLLIKVKTEDEILKQAKKDLPKGFRVKRDLLNLQDLANLSNKQDVCERIVSEKFRRFFLSYAKSINKQENRKGSLFRKYFRRKKINSDDYFKGLIWYIHNNPVKHKVHNNYKTYRWSSYNRFLIDKPSKLNKKEVFKWFGNKEDFIDFHEMKEINCSNLNNLILE